MRVAVEYVVAALVGIALCGLIAWGIVRRNAARIAIHAGGEVA